MYFYSETEKMENRNICKMLRNQEY